MNKPHLLPSAYSVAWVSALPLEAAAATQMLDEEHDEPRSHISNTQQYVFGRIGHYNVVMVCLPAGQMGTNSAAAVAGQLVNAFPSIKFALMVGIGGGVPATRVDIRLGDVVIGQPHLQHGGVVQYDFGKTGPNGHVQRIGHINAPPKVLLNAIAKLRTNHYRAPNNFSAHLSTFERLPRFGRGKPGPDTLFQPSYHHNGGDSCESCSKDMMVKRPDRGSEEVVIHYGTIASGNQVMKDGVTRDKISAELGGVLCFEMEAAGLASALPCAVIRGICDYADSHKNKGWQPYAAATAAAVAKELLLVTPVADVVEADAAGSMIVESTNYRVPFSLKGVPVGRFADRPKDMQQLEQALLPQMQPKDCRRKILVLDGLGGIGKTQLAVEFARTHQMKFTAVFWLDGSSKDNLKQSIASCASRIPEGQIPETSRKFLSGTGGANLDTMVDNFLEWLSRTDNRSWLMIFDNVDRDYQHNTDSSAYDVMDYIPEADHGSVLITTRLANLRQLGASLHLNSVDLSQAREIFRKWYNQDFDVDDSNELLRLLDGLPLALAQAAAYMSETGTTFSTYTRLYKEQWKDLLEDDDAAPLRSYGNRSITTTWTVSYNAIRAKNEGAANLLLLWAHLDHKTISFWILSEGAKKSSTLAEALSTWVKDVADEELKFWEAIRLLRSYCLVDGPQGSSTPSTHPVVHQWAFHIQDQEQRAELSRLALLMIGYAVQKDDATEYHLKHRELFPHAEFWAEKTECITVGDDAIFVAEVPYALNRMGILFRERGNLAKAEKAYQRALVGREKALGPNHRSTLNTVNNLGLLYADQGKLAEAEAMYQRALEGTEKALGPNHTSTLDTVNNLGILHNIQGKLAEAEAMYQRALEGTEKALGPNHISTLDTVNNLGILYSKQGRLAEAEAMFQRAIEGYEKALDSNHLSTLKTVSNLGSLYANQGKLAEAEAICQRVLEGFEMAWGPNHISTLNSVNDLGVLYTKQGKLTEAEAMYQRALDGYQKIFGLGDIVTYVPALHTTYNYGLVLEAQGRTSDAKLMHTRALIGFEAVFGPEHRWYLNANEGL